MLDGVYKRTDGEPVFVEVRAPSDEALQAVLHKIIGGLMKLLTRRRVLVEEEGSTYLADSDGDSEDARTRRPLQAASSRRPDPSPGRNSPSGLFVSGLGAGERARAVQRRRAGGAQAEDALA